MDEQQIRIQELAHRYKSGTATPAERAEFERWLNAAYDKPIEVPDAYARSESEAENRLLHRIHAQIDQPAKVKRLWPRIAAAASIILTIAAGGYIFLHKEQPAQQVAQNQSHDIAPGHNQATLTLANGQKIILTKGLSGKLAQQGNTMVQVNSGNAVAYTISGAPTAVEYNTLSTAKGEQSPYPLILADGTKVWLDAASSITFPTAFNGADRRVRITGQVYFEVEHKAKQPFYVAVKGLTVEDLGTRFNINAYDDEKVIKTTLLEGSVSVSRNSRRLVLKPGQEAIDGAMGIKSAQADLEEAIAWKNGYFRFNGEQIEAIMRKLSRWYNMDVQYEGKQTGESFYGTVSRYKNISEALKLLEQTNSVHFKIEGRRVTVTQ